MQYPARAANAKVFDITKTPMPKYDGPEPTGPELELIMAKMDKGLFDDLPAHLQDWVTDRLLPSMSRYGVYPPPENPPEITDPQPPGVYEIERSPKGLFKALFPLNPELWGNMPEAAPARKAPKPPAAAPSRDDPASAFAIDGLLKVGMGQIGGKPCPVVDARELHGFLEVKKDFSNWIKAQIARARLQENKHFSLLAQKGEQTGSGGHNRVEYLLTLDGAKHIGMISNTEKGFDIRDYLIACEERYYELRQIQGPSPRR